MTLLIPHYKEEKPSFIGHDLVKRLYKELFQRWYSDDEALKELLLSAILVRDSKILLVGPPEAGKTTFIRLVAKALSKKVDGEIIYSKVTGAPEKTLQRVLISTNITRLIKEGVEEFVVRPIVYARIKFINEINRFSKAVQDALLSLLEEKEVEYGGRVFRTPNYIAFADMNPYRGDIDKALKTRFLISAYIPFIGMKGSLSVMDQMFYKRRDVRDLVETMEPILSFEELEEIWDDVSKVQIPSYVALFGTMLLWAFRVCIYDKSKIIPGYLRLVCAKCTYANELCSQIQEIPGERAMIASVIYAKARAWFYGRNSVTYEDMIWIIPWVVSHRIEIVPAVKSEVQNPWEWSRNAVETLIKTKWYRKDEVSGEELYGVWAKGLALALVALGLEYDEFNEKILKTFYKEVYDSQDRLLATNILRKLAFGTGEERGDLVLQQLYYFVRDGVKPLAMALFKNLEEKAKKLLEDPDAKLSEIMGTIKELEKIPLDSADRLRNLLVNRTEEFTIRVSLSTPRASDVLFKLLREEGFSESEIMKFMSSRRSTISRGDITISIRGGTITIRTETLEKAYKIREVLSDFEV